MSFQFPLALLGLVPLAALAVLLWRQAPLLVPALPGAWREVIAPPLRRFMARDLSRPGLGQVWLALAGAACLVVAISRPLVPLGDGVDFTNLTGRVLVVDASGPGIEARRIAADEILATSSNVPTAMVALADDAYLVVPFTTDAAQIDRYLRVLTAEVMPAPGRSIEAGFALGEKVLADADIVAGQVVLITGGEPPARLVALPPRDTLRAILPADGGANWGRVAAFYDAPVATVAGIDEALDRAVARLAADLPGAVFDLAPIFYGLALLLSLALFRRRRTE